MRAKYPFIEILIDINGPDGNIFAIMGAVQREMKKAGISQKEIDQYLEEVKAGNYDEALATTRRWITFRTGELIIVPNDDYDYSPTPEQKLADDILSDMEETIDQIGESYA